MKTPFNIHSRLFCAIALISATLFTHHTVDAGELGPTRRLGAGIPTSVAVAPDGRIVAVGTSIGVYLFSTEDLSAIAFWDTSEWVFTVAYSADGKLLRVNDSIFDPAQGIRIGPVDESTEWVQDNCSPDGIHCASTLDYAGHFTVTNTQTLVVEALVSQWYTKDFAWSPDAGRLYTVSGGKSPSYSERSPYLAHTLRVYDTKTWKSIAAVEGFFADTLNQVAWSADGTKVASYGTRGGWRRNAIIWNLETNQFSEAALCSAQWREIWDCSAPRVDFKWHQVFIRDPKTGVLQRQFAPHRVYLWAAKLSPDAKFLVTSGENEIAGRHLYESSFPGAPRIGSTRIWDFQTLALIADLPVVFYKLVFSDNANIVIGQTETSIEAWDWHQGQRLWSAPQPIERQCHHFQPWCWLGPDTFHFDAVGEYVVAYSYAAANSKGVSVWRVSTGEQVATLTGHTARVTGVAFNPSGTQIAASSDDGTVLIWKVP